MLKIIQKLLYPSILLWSACSAQAAWGPFVSSGSALVLGEPSCAKHAGGQVVCAARSLASQLAINRFNGTTWSGWSVIPGVAVDSNPSCTDDGGTNVLCAARGGGGRLASTFYNGTTFSPVAFTATADRIASAPSCAALSAGNVVCVARSSTGGLASAVFNGTSWSGLTLLATPAYSAPGCAPDRAGNVICAFLNNAHATLTAKYDGSSWGPVTNIAGEAAGPPTCTEFGVAGKVVCFVTGTNDTSLWHSVFDGHNWSAYVRLLSDVKIASQSKANCVSIGASQIICAALGTLDSALYINRYAGAWSGWAKIADGRANIETPACAPYGVAQAVCIAIGVNNRVSSTSGP